MADARRKLATLAPRVSMASGNVNVAGSYGWTDDRRMSSAARGYGASWRKRRLLILERDQYLCQCDQCRGGKLRVREAHQVDHIVSKAEWQILRGTLDGVDHEGNLQAINDDCHARKTEEDRRRVYARVDGA
jgi:5-methylcytosine-specific restriction protein A